MQPYLCRLSNACPFACRKKKSSIRGKSGKKKIVKICYITQKQLTTFKCVWKFKYINVWIYVFIHLYTCTHTHIHAHTYMTITIDKLNISLCQSLAFNVCNLPIRDLPTWCLRSFRGPSWFQAPKVHLELWPRLWGCSLSQKSGYTETHAPACCTRSPKLIRKPRYLRKAEMEFLFNLFSLRLK